MPDEMRQIMMFLAAMLLTCCMRYYDRQFITHHKVNSDIMTRFHHDLEEYFRSGEAERHHRHPRLVALDLCSLLPLHRIIDNVLNVRC